MENTYRRITYHRMARLNGYVSAAKYFILEARRGRREENKNTSVCPVYTFRQSRKGEHDSWMLENSLVTHQERKVAGLRLKAVQPSRAWKPYRYIQRLVWLCTADIQTQTVSLQQKQRSSSQVKRRISRCMQTQGSQTPLSVSALVSAITHGQCTSSLLILLLLL